jgi:hypothetical protein
MSPWNTTIIVTMTTSTLMDPTMAMGMAGTTMTMTMTTIMTMPTVTPTA